MLNFLLIVTGVVIGFFSICFRRILSAIMGFIWGAGLGFLLAFLIDINSGLETGGYVAIMLILAILIAIISYKYYRFFVFLNTFLVSLVLFFVLALLVTDDMSASIPIAIVLAIIAGIVSAIIYDPLFIISTAFLGGILMSLGGVSLSKGTDFIRLIGRIIWSGSGLNQVTVWTIILSIAGIIVQFILLGKLNIGDSDNSYTKSSTATKKCRKCEEIYTGNSSCPKCGSSFYEEVNVSIPNSNIAPPINRNYGDTWVCKKCSETNSANSTSCKGCGEYK